MTRLVEVGAAAAAEVPQAAAAPTQVPQQGKVAAAALQMVLLALKALSQRALIAATNLVTLIGLGTAFWLWLQVMPNPTMNQLAGLALYGLFILGLRWIWRA